MTGFVSIIVPVYNAQSTLKRCVQSLLGQTYSDLEIILINDGSKDDSLRLCRELAEKDSRIKVIDKSNGGVSSARNAGLDAATGDYVMFCDSDDWVEPDMCECMIAHYEPDCLTLCEIAWDEETCADEEKTQLLIVERKDYLHYPEVMCAIWNKLYCRDVLEKNKIRFLKDISLGEDFCFAMNYVSAISGSVRIVKRKLYHYDTTSEGSLSKKAPELTHCDKFYWELTKSMEKIGIRDSQSIATRNDFVMRHYERFLAVTSLRRDLSFWQKMSVAGDVRKIQSFYDCCADGVKWGNPLYIWFMRHNHVRLAMVFLILRSVRDRLSSRIGIQ